MKALKKSLEPRALSPALEAAIRREELEVAAIETQYAHWPEFVRLAMLRVWSLAECGDVFGEWKRSAVRSGQEMRSCTKLEAKSSPCDGPVLMAAK